MQPRKLGKSDLLVSSVALGCWPISGLTSPDVNERDSLATLEAAVDAGINFLDTAYAYGLNGESELLIAKALGHRRSELVIASKAGLSLTEEGGRVIDGRPATLRHQCETSLARLQTDHLDLLYLHAPDPSVSISESAGALRELMQAGKARAIGASNCSLQQLIEFSAECPLTAFQPPYNLLMREIEQQTLPWCLENDIGVAIYWPLMKGLLAGELARDDKIAEGDSRLKYPMFHGEEWEKNHDLIDGLRQLDDRSGHTVRQIAVNWTLMQPGVTVALCGAKRAYQIKETAAAMNWQLTDDMLAEIDTLLRQRGTPVTRSAV